MVQIGAMATRAAADALLAGLRARFAATMHGLSTTVIPVTANGRTVYRALVTGFARAADAHQFCTGMKAGGVACLVRG
jgi:cell division protein FtsN